MASVLVPVQPAHHLPFVCFPPLDTLTPAGKHSHLILSFLGKSVLGVAAVGLEDRSCGRKLVTL